MRPDITSLARFYRTPIGRGAAHGICGQVKNFWPMINNMEVMGLGYSLPVFDGLLSSGAELTVYMPARQGVCHWPSVDHSRTALVDELHLPIGNEVMDRVLVMHALEHAPRPGALLREVWRVLKPGGRVLIIVPNRRRIWSTAENTPFGHGKPYSKRQLYNLVRDQMLPPLDSNTALMMPPIEMPAIEGMIKFGDSLLRGVGRGLGGVLLVEAEKQVYNALPTGGKTRRIVALPSSS